MWYNINMQKESKDVIPTPIPIPIPIAEIAKEFGREIVYEEEVDNAKDWGWFFGRLTPINMLYVKFVRESCGSENCFLHGNKYYTHKCIKALCFAKWLNMNGYAHLKF